MSETSMKYLRLDNHTVWPAPQSTWDLEHALRYSTSTGLTPEERMFLASVLAAYRQCAPPKVRKHPDNRPAARGVVQRRGHPYGSCGLGCADCAQGEP